MRVLGGSTDEKNDLVRYLGLISKISANLYWWEFQGRFRWDTVFLHQYGEIDAPGEHMPGQNNSYLLNSSRVRKAGVECGNALDKSADSLPAFGYAIGAYI